LTKLKCLIAIGLCFSLKAENCSTITPAKEAFLVDYVRKEFKLGSIDLKLAKQQTVGATCYRELTFEGRGPVKTWQLTMYLSPDERFLTDELLDTEADPLQVERRKNEALMAGLIKNHGASKGPDDAKVTIVEFSDFACPYCRKFAMLLDEVFATGTQVRLVFHHMPLSIHPWARIAAEGAACAQLQDGEAFWSMHDQLFRNQQAITVENIREKLLGFARATKGLDVPQFQNCLDNEMSLGLVYRDLNLASANNVNGTPTLFINGRRVGGIKDADELRQEVAQAERDRGATKIPDAQSSVR
jgi:protein-disulfide isomerase